MTIERTYDAPVSDVWQAITKVDLLHQWYFDIPEFRAEVGFAFTFEGNGPCDKPNLHLCQVVEVIPGRKLAYTWRYVGEEGQSLVTFELFPEGANTRLRLTHDGLESFSPELRGKKNFEGGWLYLLDTALKDFLQKAII
jgi:uncharacterized protein YndB with AHSA1/START domain